MTLLSLSSYARTHSASRQAAAKWRDRGALVMKGEQVDVEKSDARLKRAGLGRFKDLATPPQPPPATPPATKGRNRRRVAAEVAGAVDEVVNEISAAAADGEIDEDVAELFVEGLLNGQFRSQVEAARIKENGLALKHWLSAQKAAGRLVEIEAAEAVIFDDRRGARDAWMNWPGRIGPLLAADLGIDSAQLVEALKPYVHQQLDELGEPDLDFFGED